MASPRQRDEWTEFARRRTAELRGWLARRLVGPCLRSVRRLLNYLIQKLPSSHVLYAIGLPVAIFGWVSLAGWPLAHLVSRSTTGFQLATTEFPLSDVKDVAVDSRGRFYVVDSLSLRVQRYSPDGKFERGWFVPRKIFAVLTTADDRVVIAAEGGPRTYSCDGELIEVASDASELDRLGLVRGKAPAGPYSISRGLVPHVIDTRTGWTVVATPWPLRMIASPFPAFVYFLIGVACVGLGDLRRRREPPAPNQSLHQPA